MYRKVYGQGGFGDLSSCLKIFKLMEIEMLHLIMSLFTNRLKKGSVHINIKLDVLYLDLHRNRLKAELSSSPASNFSNATTDTIHSVVNGCSPHISLSFAFTSL